jgi:hypothetical protein
MPPSPSPQRYTFAHALAGSREQRLIWLLKELIQPSIFSNLQHQRRPAQHSITVCSWRPASRSCCVLRSKYILQASARQDRRVQVQSTRPLQQTHIQHTVK